MTEPIEPAPLSAEAEAFITRHRDTGAPTAEALARVRARLLSADAPAQRGAPLAPARAGLRNEWLAAAAVLLVIVGGEGLYLAFRTPAPNGAQVAAVKEAYRKSDLAGTEQLLAQACEEDDCARLASAFAEVQRLNPRRDALPARELEALVAADAALSDGQGTMLGLLANLERRKFPAAPASMAELDRLVAEALSAKKAQDYERAQELLEDCVRLAPTHAVCYRLLGSVHAALAARHQDAAHQGQAGAYYQRFLEVAAPEDEYVPKVRAILETAGLRPPSTPAAPGPSRLDQGPPPSPPAPSSEAPTVPGAAFRLRIAETLFQEAGAAKEAGDWRRAVDLAGQVLELAPNHLGAQSLILEARINAREAYLRGYQLMKSEPEQAAQHFQRVIELTKPTDDNHQKARSRLKELSGLP